MSSVFRPARSIGGREGRVPLARMTGQWLKRAGFAEGAKITARVSRGRIVLEVVLPKATQDSCCIVTNTDVRVINRLETDGTATKQD